MRPLTSLVCLLALSACPKEPLDQDIADVDMEIPDGGEGLTVDPTDGSIIPEVTAARAAPREGSFRWSDDGLALPDTLSALPVTTSCASGWERRSAGVPAHLAASGDGRSRAYSREEAMPMAAPMGSAAADEYDAGARAARAPAGLRAGTTDDNLDLDAFQSFVAEWDRRPGVDVERLDVSDARTLVVTDARGNPLPGAQVSVIDRATDRLVWSGTTYGDGTAPFYPHLRHGLLGERDVHGGAGWTVQARWGDAWTARSWDGEDASVRLSLDTVARGPVKLDVVFLVDTTGSMGDEIERVKDTLLSTTDQLRGLDRDFDLRYGAVLYRDLGDEYLTALHPLTGDIDGFDRALRGVRADGGGDEAESLNQGLAVAVGEMDWGEGAAKLVFLVADAPPHMDYPGDLTYGHSALAALQQGIRIHTVAASGLNDQGSVVFRQVAQLDQGRFIFIEYGSVAASAADHGVSGPVASNNLDAIIYREIRGELEGWGRPAALARR